jgi:hypothetical protein
VAKKSVVVARLAAGAAGLGDGKERSAKAGFSFMDLGGWIENIRSVMMM